MRDIVIEPQVEGKGRTFKATTLATIEADALWDGGSTSGNVERPVWAMFTNSEQELKAFVANLRTGRKANFLSRNRWVRSGKEGRLEFLKSVGYQIAWQREDEASVCTIFHPELFRIDPGMVDEKTITFILLPSKEWHAQQTINGIDDIVAHLERCGYGELPDEKLVEWAVTSHLFVAYLDRRTARPVINDPKFYAQLMLSCLEAGAATFSTPDNYHRYEEQFGIHSKGFREYGTDAIGLLPGIAFRASHEAFESLLAKEVDKYFKLIQRRKK